MADNYAASLMLLEVFHEWDIEVGKEEVLTRNILDELERHAVKPFSATIESIESH